MIAISVVKVVFISNRCQSLLGKDGDTWQTAVVGDVEMLQIVTSHAYSSHVMSPQMFPFPLWLWTYG